MTTDERLAELEMYEKKCLHYESNLREYLKDGLGTCCCILDEAEEEVTTWCALHGALRKKAEKQIEELIAEVDRLKTILDDYGIPYEGKEEEPTGDPIPPQEKLRLVQRYLRKAYLDLPEKPITTRMGHSGNSPRNTLYPGRAAK